MWKSTPGVILINRITSDFHILTDSKEGFFFLVGIMQSQPVDYVLIPHLQIAQRSAYVHALVLWAERRSGTRQDSREPL